MSYLRLLTAVSMMILQLSRETLSWKCIRMFLLMAACCVRQREVCDEHASESIERSISVSAYLVESGVYLS